MADPSAIVRRIEAITDVIQTVGIFRRFPTPDDELNETLAVNFAHAMPVVELASDTVLNARLGFRCLILSSGAAIYDVAFRVHDSKVPTGLRFFAEAVFVVNYSLQAGPHPTPAELEAFGKTNAPLNVVPFWREFLDSSIRRAGMPPVMAPVHKTEPRRSTITDTMPDASVPPA